MSRSGIRENPGEGAADASRWILQDRLRSEVRRLQHRRSRGVREPLSNG